MSSYRIEVNPNDPQSIQRALNTEWLLTNGLGGYAMGTALGVNTRRYHGLLVAATKPPVGRIVALHSMIEQLVIPREDGSEEVIDLSTQQFVGPGGEPMLHPNGWRYLRSIELKTQNPFNAHATWTWKVDDYEIHKWIRLDPGLNATQISYFVLPSSSQSFSGRLRYFARLWLRPLILLRDFHALNGVTPLFEVSETDRGFQATSSESAINVNAAGCDTNDDVDFTWHTDRQRWHHFAYVADQARGQNWNEDVWSPGSFHAKFKTSIIRKLQQGEAAQHFGLCALSTPGPERDRTVVKRRTHILEIHLNKDSAAAKVSMAAAEFVVRRQPSGSISVIAGYPWFGDWGRDTMIALPGLMLCTNRLDEARSCLMLYAQHIRNGLIPNVFDDYGGAAHYNTADASLWFVHAVYLYWKTIPSGLSRQAAELIDACRQIVRAYQQGTDFNIFMDEDSLISAGDDGSQLTWMDGKRDGVVFTPRHGKAVEINALWFNALNCVAEMSGDRRECNELRSRSRRAAESFRAKFWWNERRCLHDVLRPCEAASGGRDFVSDRKLRPNQIFAVSLPFSPLDEDQQRAVVNIVEEKLLTPFGLRTLDRDDPEYRGRYEGNLFERDRAYHNGTVWPWLIGPYCEALLRVDTFSDSSKRPVRELLQPLIDEMSNTEGGRCLGQIAEVYDGDPPHRPNGCPAQAWSVAEVLRILTLIEQPEGSGTTDEHG